MAGTKWTHQYGFLGTWGKLPRKPPRVGTTCPVCYSEPEAHEWYTTTACGHATCIDCLKSYAAMIVQDPDETGPLLCPCCPTPLHSLDALQALGGIANSQSLQLLWDAKQRDVALRNMLGYRICPHCNSRRNKDKKDMDQHKSNPKEALTYSPLVGGGFVNVGCLEERKDTRKQVKTNKEICSAVISCCSFFQCLHSAINLCPPYKLAYFAIVCLGTMILVEELKWLLEDVDGFQVADFEARLARYGPVNVACPCCAHSFPLTAVYKGGADKDTEVWVKSNTKPCPACQVPIQKTGGCPIMKCWRCKLTFCWECLEPRVSHLGHSSGCSKNKMWLF